MNKKDVVLLDKECLNNITDEILNTALYGKFFAIFLYILVYYNNNHLHLFSKAKTLYKKAKSIDYKQLAKNTASAVKNKAIAKKDAIKKKVTNTAALATSANKIKENLKNKALEKTENFRSKVKLASNVKEAVAKGNFKDFAKGKIQSRIQAKKDAVTQNFKNKLQTVSQAAKIARQIKVS